MVNFSFHIKELGYRGLYICIYTLIGYILYSEYFIEVTLYLLDIGGIKAVQISTPLECIKAYLELAIKYAIYTISIPLISYHLYFFFRPSFIIAWGEEGPTYWKKWELFTLFLFFLGPYFFLFLTSYLFPLLIYIFFLPYKNMEISTYIYWLPKLDSIIKLYFNIASFLLIGLILPSIIIKKTHRYCKDSLKKQKKLKDLIKGRHFLYFLLTFLISLLTPPDLFTLLFISLPLILIIEITYFILLLLFAYFPPSN